MKPLIALGILFLCWVIWIWWMLSTAIEGYQDENGFHEGKEPLDENKTYKK